MINPMECGEPVRQVEVRPGMTAGALVDALGRAGAYNGGSLARGVDLWERMLTDP